MEERWGVSDGREEVKLWGGVEGRVWVGSMVSEVMVAIMAKVVESEVRLLKEVVRAGGDGDAGLHC